MDAVSIPPMGGIVECRLAFVGPAALKEVRAALVSGGWLGNALEAIFFGLKVINLPISHP